jgi:hypothetical protein
MNYLKWWLVMALCMVLAAVLVPASILIVAVTNPVMVLLDRAHLRLNALRLRAGRPQ